MSVYKKSTLSRSRSMDVKQGSHSHQSGKSESGISSALGRGRSHSLVDIDRLVKSLEKEPSSSGTARTHPLMEIDRSVRLQEQRASSDVASHPSGEGEDVSEQSGLFTTGPGTAFERMSREERVRSNSLGGPTEPDLHSNATSRGEIPRRLELLDSEKAAMYRTVGGKISDFLLKQSGTHLAALMKELGKISQSFLECRDDFVNGNSGAWRNSTDNAQAANKAWGVSASCANLRDEFLAAKDSLQPEIKRSADRCGIEDIKLSLEKLERDATALFFGISNRTKEAQSFIPDNATKYEESHTYSELMPSRDRKIASNYLKESSYSDLMKIDADLVNAEKAQQVRNIDTETAYAKTAYNRLQNVIKRLEKSSKYRTRSIVSKALQGNKSSEIQRVVDRWKSRASLLEHKISVLDKQSSEIKAALLWAKPALADNVKKSMSQCADELELCAEMRSLNISSEPSYDLDDLDDMRKSMSHELHQSSGVRSLDFALEHLDDVHDRVEKLVSRVQGELNVLEQARDVIADNFRVVENSPGLYAASKADYDRYDMKADCERLRGELQTRIPTDEVISEGDRLLDEIAQQVEGFDVSDLPSSSKILCEALAGSSDHSLYLTLEKLNLVRIFCEKRGVKNADLARKFRLLNSPDVRSAMQHARSAFIDTLWTGVANQLIEEPTVEGLAMTANEEKYARALLAKLADATRTNNAEVQQKSLNGLRKILTAVDTRLDTGVFGIGTGYCDPALRADISRLWIGLNRMRDSIMPMPSITLRGNNTM